MHLESFTYDLATRSWSVPALPHLDTASTLVLAFGSPEMVAHPKVFQLLRDVYPHSALIGCSSAGVIAGAEVHDQALSVVVARFERAKLRTAAALVRDVSGSHAAGASVARKLAGPGLRALLVFAEGLRIDGDALVEGIHSVVGDGVVVAGGLAGDDTRFERTWVCSGNRLQSGLVACVGFYGDDLVVGCGSQTGWDRFGPERGVTRADGHTLYELDDAPAADVYKRYLGERLAGLPATGMLYPLALWPADEPASVSVRPLIAADAETGALMYAGAVPEGSRAQLMRTDARRLLSSAADASLSATRQAKLERAGGAGAEDEHKTPVLAVAVSGLGRRMALGERAEEELKAARRSLPAGAVCAGFYGYGEIAPGAAGRARLQHQSMTLLLLGEPAAARPRELPRGVPVRTATAVDSEPQSLGELSLSALVQADEDHTVTGVSALEDEWPSGVLPQSSGFVEVTSFTHDLSTASWSVSPLPTLDSPRTLLLAFAPSDARSHPRIFADLRLSYPRSHIIGCSAAGEILDGQPRDHALVATVMHFAHTELASAQVSVASTREGGAAGRALARELERPDLRALLVFSSAAAVPSEHIVRGLREVLGDEVAIAGGVAAGGTRGEHAWVLAKGSLARQTVAAVGLYGDHLIVGHGGKVGWTDIGPARAVTRSQGGVLLDLDGRPALDCYREALGASKGLPGHIPVALIGDDGARRWRVVVATDDRQRSLTLAGGVPAASRVQFVRTSMAQILASAASAGAAAMESAGRTGPNALGLLVGNTVRHMALGENASKEAAVAAEACEGIRLVGCYARGGLSSLTPDESALQITVLGESPTPRPARQPAPRPAASPPRPPAAVARSAAAPMTAAAAELAVGEDTRTVAELKARVEEAHADVGSGAVPVAEEDAPPFAVASFFYDAKAKTWSLPTLPALDSPRTLVLAFGAPELASTPEVFNRLRETYRRAHVIGCSSAGEIAARGVRDHSLAVAVMRFAHTELATASVVVGDAAGSFPAGQVLAHKLNEPGLRAVVLLTEGLEISGSELLRGIQSVIDDEVVVLAGGLAGDGLRFQRTWVLCGDAVQSSLVTAVGLYGDHLSVGQGAEGGWRPRGPSAIITRSAGNVLYELDNVRALDWYRERLGPQGAKLPATGLMFPLGLDPHDDGEATLVRSLLAIDETAGSLSFAGDMPQGTRVHLLGASSTQLVGGARTAARIAAEDLEVGGGPMLGLLVSAVGRRVVLGDRAVAEVEAAAATLPEGCEAVGLYAYGAFSGFRERGSEVHNQTFSVTLLAESSEPLTKPTAAAVSASGSMAHGQGLTPARSGGQFASNTPASGVGMAVAAGSNFELSWRDVGGVRLIELAGQLNEDFDSDAVAALMRGTTVLDLAHIERVSSYGVSAWLQMLEHAAPRLKHLYMARCAEFLVGQMMRFPEMCGDAQLLSFVAPYTCDNCGNDFVHTLDCNRDADELRAAAPPSVPCSLCDAPARFDADAERYREFFAPHLGEAAPRAVRRALSPHARADSAAEDSLEERAAAERPVPAPALARSSSARTNALRGAGIGVLVTALLGACLYWLGSRPSGPGAGEDPRQVPAIARADAGSAAASDPPLAIDAARAKTPPPAWFERAVIGVGDELFVIGKSGPRESAYSAAEAAYRDAVRALLEHMVSGLRGAPAHAYLRTHLGPLGADASDAAEQRLARAVARFETQLGALATLQRVDTLADYHADEGDPAARGTSLAVRYRLPRASYEQALALYRAAETGWGMSVVTVFPLLAAELPPQGELLVVEVSPRSPAARAEIEPGDLILRAEQRYVSSLEEYAAIASGRDADDDTADADEHHPRHELELELLRDGERMVKRLKRR
ncbi:FIST N-terminal domain-containing protein [Haliangium ochraceum]|uniref:Uncharacterized protein n=1 Tax=Haliangium ochraceum (strain DSM 14365 / JCM 11303 / SMP-2) TaxID=502025 RepID=D0LZC1_HALO1|nr:FIST N-terminal domain-containing protein [Haliangium ochraceum]ACY16383.1 domain of unknown function DUF1745 [Haliangium ochraceum DSM 14365]